MEPRLCLLILGMHRSGTSALTRLLNIAGAKLPARMMGAAAGNELGHWEPQALADYNDALLADVSSAWHDWTKVDFSRLKPGRLETVREELRQIIADDYGEAPLIVVKEPRVCRFSRLVMEALEADRFKVGPIITFRNPLEVVASLEARDGMGRSDAALLWLRHVLDAEEATRDRPRAIIDYDGLLSDWRGTLDQVARALQLSFPYAADEIAPIVDDYLTSKHRHHNRSVEDVVLDPLLRGWVSDAYSALRILSHAPGSKQALADLDEIRRAFDGACPFLKVLISSAQETGRAEVVHRLEMANTDLATAQARIADLEKALVHTVREISVATGRLLGGEPIQLPTAEMTSLDNLEEIQTLLAEWRAEANALAKRLADEVDTSNRLGVLVGAQCDVLIETQEILADLGSALRKGEEQEMSLREELGLLREVLEEESRKAAKLSSDLVLSEQRSAELRDHVGFRDKQLSDLQKELSESKSAQEQERQLLQIELRDRDQQLIDLRQELSQAKVAQEHERSLLQNELQDSDQQLSDLHRALSESKLAQDRSQASLQTLQRELAEVKGQLAEVFASKSWNYSRPLRGARRVLLSRPYHKVRKVMSDSARSAWYGLPLPPSKKQKLKSGLFRTLPFALSGTKAYRDWRGMEAQMPISTLAVGENRSTSTSRIDVAALQFPSGDNPEISIIIPVYNNVDYTLRCLHSMAQIDNRFSFEIIIMDDGSSDETPVLMPMIPGLRYVKNPQNLGFLRNCNKGAELARGRYLVFLNNDTEVDRDWLTALRSTFDEHRDVGLVGSKLVYPDGRLQEAGGIVWDDGSGWNWGRLKSPNHPAFNYVRDVDYVSGASIMIERDLFKRLGCFDERYQNAYYEDTDLAMSVRAAGLRVLYQPQSAVVHHEGVSSGTDTSTGVKKYQVINQAGFVEKWQGTLKKHLPNASNPLLASDRMVKGHVLIVDACTPTPDQDSGSIDMLNLIRILISMGFRVHFIPSNFAYFGTYTDQLQKMGVECVYAPYYQSVSDFLDERGDIFEQVWLARVGVAADSIGAVKRFCKKAAIVFYTVDLHHLRQLREAELNNDAVKLVGARETERLELSLMDQVDVTIVLSEAERDLLVKKGKRNIEVLPLIRELPEVTDVPFDARSGVLFIGGYQHTPNVDAVDWLVSEIWPEVRRLCLERAISPITLHLYGSQMPDRLRAYECDDIRVHGYVADLEEAFSKVRLSVAPLRYGAGLKGKLASSFGYGVPAIGTSIAYEGLPHSAFGNLLPVADNSREFAAKIVEVHVSERLWTSASATVRQLCESFYGINVARERMSVILQKAGLDPVKAA